MVKFLEHLEFLEPFLVDPELLLEFFLVLLVHPLEHLEHNGRDVHTDSYSLVISRSKELDIECVH